VIHLRFLREVVTEFKVIDETIQCSNLALTIDFPPIGVILVVLNLGNLFRSEEFIVLVCGMNGDAVGSCLNDFIQLK
jgi:hypothetical protein